MGRTGNVAPLAALHHPDAERGAGARSAGMAVGHRPLRTPRFLDGDSRGFRRACRLDDSLGEKILRGRGALPGLNAACPAKKGCSERWQRDSLDGMLPRLFTAAIVLFWLSSIGWLCA